jgi:general secretion pathway protein C
VNIEGYAAGSQRIRWPFKETYMSMLQRLSLPQTLQLAGLLAALAGGAVWSSVLLKAAPVQMPASDEPVAAAGNDNPALSWFSNRAASVDIKVQGVMFGTQGGVAVLTLNGGPARSFVKGEQLAPGVHLAAVENSAVVIERAGQKSTLPVPPLSQVSGLPTLIKP